MISKKAVFALAKALEGIPVLGTLEGTPAARAGVRYGDVLISVNGTRTRTVADYVTGKNLRLDGMDVVVFRNGANVELAFEYDATAAPIDPTSLLDVLEKLRLTGDDENASGDDDRES